MDNADKIALLEWELETARVEQARLKHDVELLTNLVEAAPDAIMIVDDAGKIRKVNGQMEELLGWSRDELLGESLDKLVPERLRDMHEHYVSGYLRSPRLRPMGSGIGTVGLAKDGSEIDVDIKLSPVSVDGKDQVIAIMRDIRPWKRAEAERQSLASEIEQTQAECKLLSGLLPICSCCKRIRDSGDKWHHLESYITDHSEAEFSHSFCPKCEKDYLTAYGLK